jgi:hypothetical protein
MLYDTRSPIFAITFAAAPAAQRARSKVFIQKEREGKIPRALFSFSFVFCGEGFMMIPFFRHLFAYFC